MGVLFYRLNILRLRHDHMYIIAAIAALRYCHIHNKIVLRKYRLQETYNDIHRLVGKSSPGNNVFKSHFDKCKVENLIEVNEILHDDGKKEVHIHPIEKAIYAKIQMMIDEYPRYSNKELREVDEGEPRNARKTPPIESVHVTDTTSCVVNAPVDKEFIEPGPKTIIRKIPRSSS
jgi:hypothetical protein